MRIVGSKLTEARVVANLSQKTLAEHLGCNTSTYCRWEQELTVPPDAAILKLVERLGTGEFVIKNNGGKK